MRSLVKLDEHLVHEEQIPMPQNRTIPPGIDGGDDTPDLFEQSTLFDRLPFDHHLARYAAGTVLKIHTEVDVTLWDEFQFRPASAP